MNAPKGGSSHYTFRKAGCQPITIPKHEPIKKVYVEIVKQIVKSEERNYENTRWLYANILSYGDSRR